MGEPKRGLRGLGAQLREIRESRKLSLDTVAELTGGFKEPITKSHLSRIENGLAEPTFRRMYALCQVYKVNITSLAELYELDLRKEEQRPRLSNKTSPDQMQEEANELCLAGDYVTALAVYEMMLDQGKIRLKNMSEDETAIHLQIRRVNCLIQTAHYFAARECAENMLDHPAISPIHRAYFLHFIAEAAWRQKKIKYAALLLDELPVAIPEVREDPLYPSLLWTKGNIAFAQKQFDEALDSYRESARLFDSYKMIFQSGFVNRLTANVHIRKKQFRRSLEILHNVQQLSEKNGYEKLTALVLSDLAYIAWEKQEFDKAEAYCRKSNEFARPREYIDLIFRNCFYLWRIAESNGNKQSAKINLRTLRTYQGRVHDSLDELSDFTRYMGGGAQ